MLVTFKHRNCDFFPGVERKNYNSKLRKKGSVFCPNLDFLCTARWQVVMLRISQSSMQTSAFHFVFLKPFAVVMIAVQMAWCVLYKLEFEYDVYDPISRRRVYQHICMYVNIHYITVAVYTCWLIILIVCYQTYVYFLRLTALWNLVARNWKPPFFHTHSSRHIENPLPNNTSLKTAEPFPTWSFSHPFEAYVMFLKLDCSPPGLGSLNPSPITENTTKTTTAILVVSKTAVFYFRFRIQVG